MANACPKIEKKHVRSIYQIIAPDFSQTRYGVWRSVREFINNLPEEYDILEVGCGNGKNMMLRPDKIVGCDTCPKFVQECVNKGLRVVYGDAVDLPYPDNSFDAVVSIAVLHHLSTEERRIQAIRDMVRTAKPGAVMMLEVWAHENNDRRTDPDNQDNMVPWVSRVDGNTYKRFIHFFTRQELENIFSDIENVVVTSIKSEFDNWIVYFSKNN